LPLLCQKRTLAVYKLIHAKRLELSTSSEDDLYNGFEDAYNAYADVYNLINTSLEKLERLKRKAHKRNISAAVRLWAGILIGVIGIISGVISIIR